MSRGPSKATRAVDLARASGAELWHDPDGEPYVDIRDRRVRRTMRVRSRACRTWLSGLLYAQEGTALGGQASTDAVDVLTAIAVHDGPEREVHVRLAPGPDGDVYLDLGDDTWQAVHVHLGGWEVVREPPVRFRRPRGLRTLPPPVRAGGKGWEELRRLLHVDSERDWTLIVAWLVGTLHPSGPYPILGLHGEHGTAKSTTGRILRSIADPSEAPLRSPPREDRELVIAARNSHIIGLDNLSRIRTWLSDALCRIATGGGYSARELYTDGEEVVYSDCRPILMTSIEGVATRGDLSDRTITVTLPLLPEEERRAESDLWADVEMWQGAILGDLLSAAATGLRRIGHVRLDRLPRMADFATWVVACEPALPWDGDQFLGAYADQREEAVETGIEADPVAVALVELLESKREWKGTATDLLATLDGRRDGRPTPKGWPETPQAMGGRLTRAAPLLRASGLSVCRYRDTDSERTRIVHLHKYANACPGCPSSSGRPGLSGGRPGENPQADATSDNPDKVDNDLPTRAISDIQELALGDADGPPGAGPAAGRCPGCGGGLSAGRDMCETCASVGASS